MFKKVLFLCFCVLSTSFISAEKFEFLYNTGHTYTIESTVNQEVFVNDVKSHDALIENVVVVSELEAQTDGSCRIKEVHAISETATFPSGRSQSSSNNESILYVLDKSGNTITAEKDLLPVVRSVPVFPTDDIEIGDTWSAPGEEVHDFSASFGINNPIKIPFEAKYTYDRIEKRDNTTYHVFLVSYDSTVDIPLFDSETENPPNSMHITSKKEIFWDTKKACVDSFNEDYTAKIKTIYGDVIQFNGITDSKIVDFPERKVDVVLEEMKTEIANIKSETIKAHVSTEGITLSLENIQFAPNSAVLQEDAKKQLRQIKELLAKLPNNDLLIIGHTALAGTEEGRQTISEQRAQSVADYLFELGVRAKNQMEVIGHGADDPIVPNTTKENMSKNRRVEITVKNK